MRCARCGNARRQRPDDKDDTLRKTIHAREAIVFDRKRLFIGSMNFDQRSMHLNTEIGLIIDSPELAQQTVARFESMTSSAQQLRTDAAPRRRR